MATYNLSNGTKFNDLLQSMYSATDINVFRQLVLQGIMGLVPFDSAAFFLTDDVSFLEPYSVNLDESTFTSYKQHYEILDQYKTAVFAQPFIPPVDRSSDYLNYGEWQKNEHRADFLLRQNIYNLACVQVFAGENLVGMISLHRNRKQADFSDTEMQTLLLLSSYLNRAFSKQVYLGQLSPWGDTFDKVFDLVNASVLVINCKLEVIYVNPLARGSILAKDSGYKRNKLMDHLKSICGRMLHMDRLCGTWALTTSFSDSTRKRNFHIFMQTPTGKANPQFVVYEPKSVTDTIPLPEEVGKDLSYKEKEVAQLLVLGKSNEEIARTLLITINTVKSHVSNILHKAGVKTRAEFMAGSFKGKLAKSSS
ncbi:MAG: LuxR C-terminal-related transcriptional regulator [Carboxydocellales bacterium]